MKSNVMAQHTKTMESAASDQTSREATRELNPPILRSCSASPFIPTPLYSTVVCRALRQPFRGSFCVQSSTEPSKSNSATQAMYAYATEPATDFSRGCAPPMFARTFLLTRPPTIREVTRVNASHSDDERGK